MATDRLLELVGRAGGPLADAKLWRLEVVEVSDIAPDFRRLILTAPDLHDLRYTPGQDLMLRVPRRDESVTNRRYTIRRLDRGRSELTIDVSLHGAGPGTDWVRQAAAGDRIDAIGPRGKITPRLEADWHLFVGDETGVPGALAMIESLPPTSMAFAVLEVGMPEDEQELDGPAHARAAIDWVHRPSGSQPGDATFLHQALREFDPPNGSGHVYVAAESAVVRDLRSVLIDRGLQPEQISAKSYWRRGLPNADHGEPVGQD